ncbi:polyphosphate kinase [Marinobacter caseinilyticus]|uniref:polyphosphate kinase n=1 Tax=Marinobacter caseinilyticus TaxID=2692195 RepID=UPI00140AB72E|nr:polyphosphate kinase [Marinobacter caseinilyticus]
MTVHSMEHPFLYQPRRRSLSDYASDCRDDGLAGLLEASLETIGEYQRRLWANREKALLLIVHGMDASGKDSLIRTLATYMDPAGFHAWSFGRPQGAEVRHDFLWRVMPCLPAFGEVAAFNRSHHEAVMAERLWPMRAPDQYDWPARYQAIRAFEQHLVQEGTSVVKCWLQLSPAEHKRRLLTRLDTPRKRWKFDAADVIGWQQRENYRAAAEEAIAATHTPEAPWLIIPGDRKPIARAIVATILAERLQRLAPNYPREDESLLQAYRDLLQADT